MARVHDRDGKPRPSEPSEPTDPATVNGQVRSETVGEGGWCGKLQKPKAEIPAEEARTGAGPVDPFALTYPALVAFLRDVTFSDGSRRTPGSIVLFVQDGLYTVCLTEKGVPEKVAFQAARTVSLALRMAEEGLRTNDLPWRSPKRSWKGSRA